jgi:GNAT superfamily N-acetyltransferase
MAADIVIRQVTTRGQRADFVKFPWRVYKGDRNWVPPLISDQMDALDPKKSEFYKHADVALFAAYQGGKVAGTIAAFVDHQMIQREGQPEGGFGFFEVVDDFQVFSLLMDAACDWQRQKGIKAMSGPTSFTENDNPGVLVEGADCPPAMLEAHTPPYYKDFLEKYGMEKYHDLFAWRAHRDLVGEGLKNLPPDILRVAEMAKKAAKVNIRKLRMENWDQEIATAVNLFNATLSQLPTYQPMELAHFRKLANKLKMLVDPDMALFAEVEGRPVGFIVALPDINRLLIHLNGHLFPFNWLRVSHWIRQIDVISFKLMGVLEEYRHRGIDAMLYLEAVKAFYNKGYTWIDGSVTSEFNPAVNLLPSRVGAERYKHYRIYQIKLQD